MTPSDPFSTEENTLSHVSLAVANAIAQAGSEGISLAELRRDVTQYAEDKIKALRKHGWVIAEDHALDGQGRVYVLVVDPGDRKLAA